MIKAVLDKRAEYSLVKLDAVDLTESKELNIEFSISEEDKFKSKLEFSVNTFKIKTALQEMEIGKGFSDQEKPPKTDALKDWLAYFNKNSKDKLFIVRHRDDSVQKVCMVLKGTLNEVQNPYKRIHTDSISDEIYYTDGKFNLDIGDNHAEESEDDLEDVFVVNSIDSGYIGLKDKFRVYLDHETYDLLSEQLFRRLGIAPYNTKDSSNESLKCIEFDSGETDLDENEELISSIDFLHLDKKGRKAYVKKRLGLSSLSLIGKSISERFDNYFFIKDLYNPDTGEPIKNFDIFSDIESERSYLSNTRGIYCKFPKDYDLSKLEGNILRFKFNIRRFNSDRLLGDKEINESDVEEIIKGSYLESNIKDIEVFEDESDLLNKHIFKIDKSKLKLIIESNNGLNNIYISENLYRDVFEKDLLKKQSDIKAQEERLKEKSRDLQALEVQIKNKERKIIDFVEKLRVIGLDFIEYKKEIDSLEEEANSKDIKSIYNEIILEWNEEKELKYNLNILRRFHTAIFTNELIVLTGPSRTGKSSLVRAYATAIGAEFINIPVQPTWMDKQDLIGYYNPVNREYVPTEFLNFIKKANENENKKYILCLDEMNLAQVEFYLADILSQKEQKEDKSIQLYSEYEYEKNRSRLNLWTKRNIRLSEKYKDLSEDEFLERLDEIDVELEVKDERDIENLIQLKGSVAYGHKVKLPDNLYIVGTMNTDGTVKPLSPKVIDRSFIVNVDGFVEEDYKGSDVKIEDLRERLGYISNELDQYNAGYSYRVKKQIESYIDRCNEIGYSDGFKILDDIIMMKFLPRFNAIREDNINKSLYNSLKNIFSEIGEDIDQIISYRKLSDMIEKSKDSNIMTYWS